MLCRLWWLKQSKRIWSKIKYFNIFYLLFTIQMTESISNHAGWVDLMFQNSFPLKYAVYTIKYSGGRYEESNKGPPCQIIIKLLLKYIIPLFIAIIIHPHNATFKHNKLLVYWEVLRTPQTSQFTTLNG